MCLNENFKMKRIIKSILVVAMWLWSKIYTYNFSIWLKNKRDVLYTLWIRNQFGSFGEGSAIGYPCSLQGGGQNRIRIGSNTSIACHGILGCWERYRTMDADGSKKLQRFEPEIEIGDYCSIGEYTHISAVNKITIGDGLLTGRYVYIGDNAHGGMSWEEAEIRPVRRNISSKGEIKIGSKVWIGDKVTVLAGVHIGDNVIVAANAVVTKDVPANCVVAGVPAIIVKRLQ